MRIEGRRVFLRPARLRDFRQWANLRRASRDYLSPIELEWDDAGLAQIAFERRLSGEARAIAEGRGYPFLILRHDGVLVGGLTLGPIVQHVARLGTWIGTPFVGRGYALHAVEAAMSFAFGEAGLVRVEAITLQDNLASIRVLGHCGFADTGRRETYEVAGVEREHVVYSRARECQ